MNLNRFKNKLYYFFVIRNFNIKYEYEKYVLDHLTDHNSKRIKHWAILIKLNWHYRILRKKTPLLYIDPKDTTMAFKNIINLEDSESMSILNRRLHHQLAKELLKYDIISFDIFDTLLFRPFSRPRDIFMILGQKFDYLDFYKIRNDMEMLAREKAFAQKGNREVTLIDIYKEIENYTGIPAEYGAQIEFETELEFCFANPYMKSIFSILKSYGKKIIAVSDMWLTKSQITQLLEHCDYKGFYDIYVSNEYNANKTTKTLFKVVNSKKHPGESVVHIGDNLRADIENARAEGWEAIYYKGVNDIGNPYRVSSYGMSPLIGSIYSGIINARLHNGLYQYSPYYEYGYIYGGIYVLGFCHWIKQYVLQNKIGKVLFLARDGEIYKKVFCNIYPEIDNEYVLWSRIINARLTAEKGRFNFFQRMIRARINSATPITIGSLIQGLKLHFLLEQLPNYNLNQEFIILETNHLQIEQLFIDNWNEVLEVFEKESTIACQYFKTLIGDNKEIAVVDVGWQGTGVIGLKWLIEKKWKLDCNVHCLMAATQAKSINVNQLHVLNGTLHSYLFDFTYNKNLYKFHQFTNNGLNSFLFEIFTQATFPTFSGFSSKEGKIKLEFGTPEIENYKFISEIQKGIMDFTNDYMLHTHQYPFLLNISGNDAYTPFQVLASNTEYFKKYFSDFTYSIVTDISNNQSKLETIGDILKK